MRGEGEASFDGPAGCIPRVFLVSAFTWCNIPGSHSATSEIIDPLLKCYMT